VHKVQKMLKIFNKIEVLVNLHSYSTVLASK